MCNFNFPSIIIIKSMINNSINITWEFNFLFY